ncbi:chitooligosaccharide deacetylase NodB [Bradyrhizobium diazoefficiens]|uniref:chitooligosaccharide deacetylase NodB n=1 Tax=Bradyrhizobium diazoefficiens TaxID=1355477 RepID=UPI00190DAC7D|nr:chitooligosaccharide deacetylase NodB [Bradyrhizobium diazoefficiens]MBK3666635.1 chitooligosaccharide deacetylase NodB [Bradyrhizobium diazoefficiens]
MTSLGGLSEARGEHVCATGDRNVYLTFDDGPDPRWTASILDVLAEYGVPATFFVIGACAAAYPKLIQRMIAEGHEVGNHTMTHPDLSRCEPAEVEHEIQAASDVIRAVCPEAPLRHIRAPYGIWTDQVRATSTKAGLIPLHWSVDPRDWSRPGVPAIVDAVLTSVRPGAVVLLHDGCPPGEREQAVDCGRDQTVEALSRLIPALGEQGFAICSLPQSH